MPKSFLVKKNRNSSVTGTTPSGTCHGIKLTSRSLSEGNYTEIDPEKLQQQQQIQFKTILTINQETTTTTTPSLGAKPQLESKSTIFIFNLFRHITFIILFPIICKLLKWTVYSIISTTTNAYPNSNV